MPSKIKKVTVQPEEKVVVKPVVKKPAAKKSVVKSNSKTRSGSAGKTTAKKTVVKKSAPSVSVKVEQESVPVVTIVEKEVHTVDGPVEVRHKYVFIGSCRSCDHMPISANKLVAVLSIAIAILSGLLISTTVPMNFQMPSISFGSLSDLITPDSQVKNL